MQPFRDAMRYRSKQVMRSYWIVLSKNDGKWCLEFGDYDKANARSEFNLMRYDLPHGKKHEIALVQSPSDLQSVLDGIVKAWNVKR